MTLEPIYFGPHADNSLLGTVAVGYEMNGDVARQVAQVAASQVAIVCGPTLVVSTLNGVQSAELRSALLSRLPSRAQSDWKLGNESFVVTSLALNPSVLRRSP